MKMFFIIIFISITQVFSEANSNNLGLKNLSYNEEGKIDQNNEFNSELYKKLSARKSKLK
jgi:hypothetical protein